MQCLSCTLPMFLRDLGRETYHLFANPRDCETSNDSALWSEDTFVYTYMNTNICTHMHTYKQYIRVFIYKYDLQCDLPFPKRFGAFILYLQESIIARASQRELCSAEEKIANEKCWLKKTHRYGCVTCVSIRVKMMHQCCTEVIAEKSFGFTLLPVWVTWKHSQENQR